MAATGRELIQRALVEVGVLASGEDPSGQELQDAHVIAKRMVDAIGADRLALHEVRRTTLALTNGTRDYSIGPGGAVDVPRPAWIDMAGYIQDSTVTDPIETPIEVFTDQRWAQIRLKTLDSAPLLGVYYDKRFDANLRGLLQTYPTINITNAQLVIYMPRPMPGDTSGAFHGLDTQYTFPVGYEEAWHYELSTQLCGPFQVPRDTREWVRTMRQEAWARVKRTNFKPDELFADATLPTDRSGASSLSRFNTGWR